MIFLFATSTITVTRDLGIRDLSAGFSRAPYPGWAIRFAPSTPNIPLGDVDGDPVSRDELAAFRAPSGTRVDTELGIPVAVGDRPDPGGALDTQTGTTVLCGLRPRLRSSPGGSRPCDRLGARIGDLDEIRRGFRGLGRVAAQRAQHPVPFRDHRGMGLCRDPGVASKGD